MATDMTSALRAFAFKKLEEAKQRGASLASVQAATATLADVTAASLSKLSSNVPASIDTAAALFRNAQPASVQAAQAPATGEYDARAALSIRLRDHERGNQEMRAAMADAAAQAMSESVYKMDLINESLAFTIENIQEAAHVMSLLNRQLRDSATMQNPKHKDFYRRPAETGATDSSDEPKTSE